jgi:hypothetical protein
MTKQKTKPHEPAFNYHAGYPEEGLTKREYFAAMAMQGLLANGKYICNYKLLGEESVMFANALIEALNNTDNPNLQP